MSIETAPPPVLAPVALGEALGRLQRLPSELGLGEGAISRFRLVHEGHPLGHGLVCLVDGARAQFGVAGPDGTVAVQLPPRLPPVGGPKLLAFPVRPEVIVARGVSVAQPASRLRTVGEEPDLAPAVLPLRALIGRDAELELPAADERFLVLRLLGAGLDWAAEVLGRTRLGLLFSDPAVVVYPHRPGVLSPETFVHPLTANLALRGLDEKHAGDRLAFAYELWHELGHVLHFRASARSRVAGLLLTARLFAEQVVLQAGRGHWLSKATTPFVALAEGWAAFAAQAVYRYALAPGRRPATPVWKGVPAGGDAPEPAAAAEPPDRTPVPVAVGPRAPGRPRAHAQVDLTRAGRGPRVEGAVASWLWRLYRQDGAGPVREAFELMAAGADDVRRLLGRWLTEGRPYCASARAVAEELELVDAGR